MKTNSWVPMLQMVQMGTNLLGPKNHVKNGNNLLGFYSSMQWMMLEKSQLQHTITLLRIEHRYAGLKRKQKQIKGVINVYNHQVY